MKFICTGDLKITGQILKGGTEDQNEHFYHRMFVQK